MHSPQSDRPHAPATSSDAIDEQQSGQSRKPSTHWLVLALCFVCFFLVSDSYPATSHAPSSPFKHESLSTSPIPFHAQRDLVASLDQALRSVHRMKIRFDASYLLSSGDKLCVLSGTAQFESREDNSKPVSYLKIDIEGGSQHSIELYFKEDKAAVKGLLLDDQWVTTTVTDSLFVQMQILQGSPGPTRDYPFPLLAIITGIPGFNRDDFQPVIGLPLSSEDHDETWQVAGQSEQNERLVLLYTYRSGDDAGWNKILPGILENRGIIEGVSSEVWLATVDSLPHHIRYTIDINLGAALGRFQIEINLNPYDFNQALELPDGLPY